MAKKLGDTAKAAAEGEDKARIAEMAGNVSQETFLQSCQEIAAVNLACKAAADARAKVRKTIKARGIELGILDATLKMADWDREEVRLAFDNRRRYAEWLGLPIGIQADMFKDKTPEQKAQMDAHGRGVTDARTGKSGQPPEDLAEDLAEFYTRGFKGKPLEKEKKEPKEKVRKDKDGNILAPAKTPEREADDAEFDKAGADVID